MLYEVITMSTFIRLSMFQPHETEEIIYTDQREYDWQLETIDGQKVNLNDFRRITSYNVCYTKLLRQI